MDNEIMGHVDMEVIDDLVENINSWSTFYIVCEDSFEYAAQRFQKDLELNDVECVRLFEGMEDIFKENICENDVLLAISEKGNENFIRNIVKVARFINVKVYAICGDFKSGLVLLSDESFIIKENFSINLLSVLEKITDRLTDDFLEEEFRIMEPHPAYMDPRAPGNIISPLFGTVLKICVNEGDEVNVGDKLCVIESLKMENEVLSEVEGIVQIILVEPGDNVTKDTPLMNIM